jgi:DNA repair protein RecO (recombination protein O)
LLTEARVVQRFGQLRSDLAALYAGYYIAELLSEWTEDYDPHPSLFDEARDTLQTLGTILPGRKEPATGLRLARFELVLLRELGYSPVLERCAACAVPCGGQGFAFCPAVGGVLCPACQPGQRDRRPLSREVWEALRALNETGEAWQRTWGPAVRKEVRQVLGQYVTYLLGRRPRLLPYLGS